jgi:hypothetical protein
MPQNNLGVAYARGPAGTFQPFSSDGDGALVVSQAEANTFLGANPSGVTTSAALATTYVGLVVSNPAASGINVVLRRVSGVTIVAPAALLGFNLITGWSAAGIVTHTTALVPFSRIIGTGPTPKANLDSAATLVGTPVFTMPLAETSASAALVNFSVDLEGAVILPPGAYAAIGTTIAGPAAGFMGAFQWEEVAGTQV